MRTRGIDDVRSMVSRAIERGADLRRPLRVLAEGIQAVVAESFASASDPEGRPWPRLAASTIERKLADRYGVDPLVRTGKLRARITTRITPRSVIMGLAPDVAYGVYHQLGAGVPARRFLPFTGDPARPTLSSGARMRRVFSAYSDALRRHLFGGR